LFRFKERRPAVDSDKKRWFFCPRLFPPRTHAATIKNRTLRRQSSLASSLSSAEEVKILDRVFACKAIHDSIIQFYDIE
jgi:hypothetical protein